jgi:YVTN family beta-propeller protein
LVKGEGYDASDWAAFPLAALDAGQVRAGAVSFLHRSSGAVAHARTVSNRGPQDGKPGDLVTLTRVDFERQKTAAAGYRVVEFTVTPDPSRGANCLRYELIREIPPRRQGDAPTLLEGQGFRCLHPRWPAYGVDLGYGRPHRSGQTPTPPGVEVGRFLSSLAFTTDQPVLVTDLPIDGRGLGVAAGADSVWIHLGPAGQVLRIDPAATHVVATVPVGRGGFALAVGDGSVWVANQDDDTVSRIDLGTNRVTATIQVGRRPSFVAVGAGAVWVSNAGDQMRKSGTVSRIDPVTNQVAATIGVGVGPSGIAIGEGAVWVANLNDQTVSRIDPERNEVIGAPIRLPGRPHFLATGSGGVWTTMQRGGGLAKIDPRTNQVVRVWKPREGAAWGLAAGARGVWVTNPPSNTIARIDPRAVEPLDTPILLSGAPIGLALGADGTLYTTRPDRTFSRLEP